MDRDQRRKRGLRRRIGLSFVVIAAFASMTALGVYGLFSATTGNAGNQISSGTVTMTDNDASAALYNPPAGLKPGDAVTKCIKTTYTGSLPADVKLYASGTPGLLAPYIDLVITPGTQTGSPAFPDCTGFSADAGGAIFTGTLQSFEQNKNSYANGIATTPAAASSWTTNSTRVYRISATLQASAPDSAQGVSTGTHSFIWEARNQ